MTHHNNAPDWGTIQREEDQHRGDGGAFAPALFTRIDPALVEEQRAAGWPDMHPEDFCHRCGIRNHSWAADRQSWLEATTSYAEQTGHEGILCPSCFIELHQQATGQATIWAIHPYDTNLDTVTEDRDRARRIAVQLEQELNRAGHDRLAAEAEIEHPTQGTIKRIADRAFADGRASLVAEVASLRAQLATFHHTVTVTTRIVDEGTEDEQRVVDRVTFKCRAAADADCRTYPDCDCESWSWNDAGTHDEAGHERKPGHRCWLADWFDVDGACYVGDDGDDMRDDQVPAVDRSGPITTTWCEDYIEWDWAVEASEATAHG